MVGSRAVGGLVSPLAYAESERFMHAYATLAILSPSHDVRTSHMDYCLHRSTWRAPGGTIALVRAASSWSFNDFPSQSEIASIDYEVLFRGLEAGMKAKSAVRQ